MKKEKLSILILPLFSLALMCCSTGGETSSSSDSSSSEETSSSSSESTSSSSESTSTESVEPTPFTDTEYYDKINERVVFDLDAEINIDEDFSGGMKDDYWYALDGVWQNDSASRPHNGVQTRNLYYVKDGDNTMLAFKGHGYYDKTNELSGEYYKPEGACILSKNHLGPGRYEFEMAALPREGAVSAAWTYCTTTGSEATSQNEIDIEIGGNMDKSFKQEWCTSWVNHTNKATNNIDVSSLLYLNDGKIHKYTFDWYTSYPSTNDCRVDWFIDGILITSLEGSGIIPFDEMPLWVGVWFPNWCPEATFESDYMLVDAIRYTAFDYMSQPYDSCRAEASYVKTVPSTLNISEITLEEARDINLINNGDFTSLDICKQDGTYFGWSVDSASAGTLECVNGSFVLTAGESGGEYVTQRIPSQYEGYSYTYEFNANLAEGSEGQVEIRFRNLTDRNISTEVVTLEEGEKGYSGTFTCPTNTDAIRVDLVVEKGEATFSSFSVKKVYSD